MIKDTSARREELGSIVKRLREEKGSTVRKLAKASNISSSYLCRIELGKSKDPSVFILQDIAKALNVKMDFLLSGNRQTFEQVVNSSDFTIGDSKFICKEGKGLLLQLVIAILSKDWNNESIFEIHNLIIELKETLSKVG